MARSPIQKVVPGMRNPYKSVQIDSEERNREARLLDMLNKVQMF